MHKKVYIIEWLEQTADIGCPSLWEGETQCGKMIYVRWRHGIVYVFIGNNSYDYYQKNPKNMLRDGKIIFRAEYDLELDMPWLTTDVLLELTKEVLVL